MLLQPPVQDVGQVTPNAARGNVPTAHHKDPKPALPEQMAWLMRETVDEQSWEDIDRSLCKILLRRNGLRHLLREEAKAVGVTANLVVESLTRWAKTWPPAQGWLNGMQV